MRRALERETGAARGGLQSDRLSIQVVFDAPNNRKSAGAAQVLLDASATVDLANLREKIVADLSYLTDLRETIAKDIEVLANLHKMTATDLTKLARPAQEYRQFSGSGDSCGGCERSHAEGSL